MPASRPGDERLPLVDLEPVVVTPDIPDVYISGIGRIDILEDGNVRLCFYSNRGDSREPRREVVLCLVGAAGTIDDMVHRVLTSMARQRHTLGTN